MRQLRRNRHAQQIEVIMTDATNIGPTEFVALLNSMVEAGYVKRTRTLGTELVKLTDRGRAAITLAESESEES
jgi:DNA-binding MarR family transcriptional regulator